MYLGVGGGVVMAPYLEYIYIYRHMYVLILAILLYKNYTLPLFNNIIDSFKSKVITINFSITFLQIVEVASF